MAAPYLGSTIALISKAEIRYEGILYTIDPEESTVALSNVRSFGTEGRPTSRPVPPREDVFDYIIFRGSDIKDLTVCSGPSSTLQDPAIVDSSKSTTPLASSSLSATSTSTPGASYQHFAPAPALAPASAIAAIPSAGPGYQLPAATTNKPVKAPVGQGHARHQPQQASQQQPKYPQQPRQNVQQQQQQQFHGRVAPLMDQMTGPACEPSHTVAGREDQITVQQSPNSRGASRGGRGQRGGRGGGMGRGGNRRNDSKKDPIKFDTDFDFDQSNSQFNKEDIEKELKEKLVIGGGSEVNGEGSVYSEVSEDTEDPAFYNKSKSFFDTISSDATERNRRPNWRQERKLNSETFGESGAWRGGFRGGGMQGQSDNNRGGGGYNRGYSGGGGGGYYNRGGGYRGGGGGYGGNRRYNNSSDQPQEGGAAESHGGGGRGRGGRDRNQWVNYEYNYEAAGLSKSKPNMQTS